MLRLVRMPILVAVHACMAITCIREAAHPRSKIAQWMIVDWHRDLDNSLDVAYLPNFQNHAEGASTFASILRSMSDIAG